MSDADCATAKIAPLGKPIGFNASAAGCTYSTPACRSPSTERGRHKELGEARHSTINGLKDRSTILRLQWPSMRRLISNGDCLGIHDDDGAAGRLGTALC